MLVASSRNLDHFFRAYLIYPKCLGPGKSNLGRRVASGLDCRGYEMSHS